VTSPTDRLTVDGQTLTRRVWGLIADARAAAGLPQGAAQVMQGSFTGAVGASAGTHKGGGAFDLSIAGLVEPQQIDLVTELRRRNACAWIRAPKYGWSGARHIHGIVRDEPGRSPSANAQVVSYDNRRNGLANQGPDPFPRPKQYPTEEVAAMTAADGWLALKDTAVDRVRSNGIHVLDIKGQTRFLPEAPGRSFVALYANLDLPPSGSADRLAVARGGVRIGYRQVDKTQPDGYDETGYFGPIPVATHGNAHFLISHTWPHTTSAAKPWEFFLEVYAFNADGSAADVVVELETREVKIVDRIDPPPTAH
jgi:hypothetical protein